MQKRENTCKVCYSVKYAKSKVSVSQAAQKSLRVQRRFCSCQISNLLWHHSAAFANDSKVSKTLSICRLHC